MPGSLLANVMGLLALWMTVLCIVGELVMLVLALVAPAQWDMHLILRFATIMMPFMISICLVAVGSAALNCVKHFTYPAAAPIILNLCNILATVVLSRFWKHSESKLMVVSFSVLAASIIQLVGVLWVLHAHNLPWWPRLRPVHPGVPRMLKLMLPMLLGLGVLQINALGDSLVAWIFSAKPDSTVLSLGSWQVHKPLSEGVVTVITNAERLYQFPLGVMAIALATAVFPLMSRYAARGDKVNLRLSVNQAMRLAIFEGLPSGAGLMLLAQPLTMLLFSGGKSHYTPAAAAATAHVVVMYGIGMWAFCSQQVLLRAFYAQKDTTTPLKISCSIVVLNFVLNLVFIWVPGIRQGAFGLSTSITAMLNVIILSLVLRQRLGRLGIRSLLASVARIAAAVGVMALAVWASGNGIKQLHLGSRENLARVACGVVVGAAAFLLTCKILRARSFLKSWPADGRISRNTCHREHRAKKRGHREKQSLKAGLVFSVSSLLFLSVLCGKIFRDGAPLRRRRIPLRHMS